MPECSGFSKNSDYLVSGFCVLSTCQIIYIYLFNPGKNWLLPPCQLTSAVDWAQRTYRTKEVVSLGSQPGSSDPKSTVSPCATCKGVTGHSCMCVQMAQLCYRGSGRTCPHLLRHQGPQQVGKRRLFFSSPLAPLLELQSSLGEAMALML